MTVDWTKVVVVLAVICGAVVLCALDKIGADATTGTITGVSGYLLGHGVDTFTVNKRSD